MTASYIARAGGGNDQVVPRPRATDAIGAALRDAYEATPGMPTDMARLIRRLDRSH